MKINTFKSKEETLDTIVKRIDELLALNKGKKILFLSSGGSSLEILNFLDSENLSLNVTLGVTDERSDTNPKINNFPQLLETNFGKAALEKGCSFIDTTFKESMEPQDHAYIYGQQLENWLHINPEGIIIATLGIGPDGHCAGIMPFPENPEEFKLLFEDETQLTVAYDATGKNEFNKRVSTTIPFFRKITYPLSFVTGQNKLEALNRVLALEGTLAETPARILRELENEELFTDIMIQ